MRVILYKKIKPQALSKEAAGYTLPGEELDVLAGLLLALIP
jgi:hypothetical protein